MKWGFKEYTQWIKNGHPINKNVTELYISRGYLRDIEHVNNLPMLKVLDCTDNYITQLDNLKLPMLEKLYCRYNNLTYLDNPTLLQRLFYSNNKLTQLDNLKLPMLKELDCRHNNITHLDNLNLPMLKELNCSHNKITQLNNLTLPMLQRLTCYNNNLTQLDNLNLPMLEVLECINNNITQLDNLNLPMLKKLVCNDNKLTQLDNLNLPMLKDLDCGNNNITNLRLQHIQHLTKIIYYNNPIEFIAPNLLRAINRTKQNVYTDGQNVHNHNIQECIRKSIQNIINITATINDINQYILQNDILTEQSKQLLFEYMEDETVHSTMLITFKELLTHTLSRVEQNEHKQEILNILNTELNDSMCKCYTGRMSRLVNCLNGFDELVEIQISESEQIGQIIIIIKDDLKNKGVYTVVEHKKRCIEELKLRGYDMELINTWVEYIE